MRSPKKRIRHRDRNYMIYVLTFLIALTGILGISKGSPVLAAEEESTQKGSISIVCPVEGMELSLYRVAEYEESGSFTLTERFRKYPVSLEQKNQEGWQGTADALADYIRRDGITADAVLASGSDRKVCFTDLNRGLYLVLGQTTEQQEDGKTQIYEPQTASDSVYRKTASCRRGRRDEDSCIESVEAGSGERTPGFYRGRAAADRCGGEYNSRRSPDTYERKPVVLYMEESFYTDALERVRGRGSEWVYRCCHA